MVPSGQYPAFRAQIYIPGDLLVPYTERQANCAGICDPSGARGHKPHFKPRPTHPSTWVLYSGCSSNLLKPFAPQILSMVYFVSVQGGAATAKVQRPDGWVGSDRGLYFLSSLRPGAAHLQTASLPDVPPPLLRLAEHRLTPEGSYEAAREVSGMSCTSASVHCQHIRRRPNARSSNAPYKPHQR